MYDREPSRAVTAGVRVISALFTFSLVTLLVMGAITFAIHQQYNEPGPLQTATRVIIPPGESRIAIAERLEREGVIANRWTFVGGHLLQSFTGGAKKRLELKAGEYEVKEHASMRQVLETLAEGKSILYKVTVPEGLTSQQIVERLKAEANLVGDVTTTPSEGSLLPDTYMFSKGTPRQEIIQRMQVEMGRAVAEMWEKRKSDLPLRSPEEAVTFASIVEKETGRADERTRVASVFYNRLKKGMRLQSDPTIVYGIVGGEGSLGRGITRADIDTKTPYNTYQINGLPPGPIANPGRAALEAAFNPAESNDLYFVADGTGGHTFTDTLKEHNSAVQKWRDTEKQAKSKTETAKAASEPDPDAAPIPPNDANLTAAADPAPAKPATGGPKTIKPASSTTAAIPLPVKKPKPQAQAQPQPAPPPQPQPQP
ncbi:MAG: endolytic transglycosylase MltG [Hyphomicrobium sp.]